MSRIDGLTQEEVAQIIEYEWLNLPDVHRIQVESPLTRVGLHEKEPLENLLNVMRDPDYFGFTSKHLFNKVLPPMQLAILRELWHRPFPMLIGSRGMGKSFILALYAMMRATLNQGVKIVIVGNGFRQAKVIFDYCEEIWFSSPMLRDVCSDSRKNGPRRDIDRCTLRIGDSLIIALPLGDGTKIRGQRANVIIADEFASIPNEVFENVVSGFAAVSMDPIDKLQNAASKKAMHRLGIMNKETSKDVAVPGLNSNQTILSGTAYYGFNHFYHYWQRYKSFIESRGDPRKLSEIFNGEDPGEKFDYRDYAIIRVPVKLLPDGFMDAKHVEKARATIHMSQYLMEYGACFAVDSNGFFKRSLIEKCVVSDKNPIQHRSCGQAMFNAVLRGDPNRQYVLAIDPASEIDNFAIAVLELWPDHRRIVHVWTTTRKRHKAKFRKGLVREEDFYSYIARKVRDLMDLFPCERIAIDSQGGGIGVMEALGDRQRLAPGEKPILPVRDPEKEKDTDNIPGHHILEVVNFAKSDWVSEANHGMRKDFEDRVLLFPEFDPAVLAVAIEEDKILGRVKVTPDGEEKLYDTLEDCFLEIEELKDELATIVHTQSGTSMRDRWDTPEVKIGGGKKGRLRKDRYSALLMANMVGRIFQRIPVQVAYPFAGGFTKDIVTHAKDRKSIVRSDWQNPEWYEAGAGGSYGAVVRRK